MWPPNLPSARIGRSRFTVVPGRSASRLVRSRVSRERSAVKLPPSNVRTVRHTPLTAMLAPLVTPSRMAPALTRNVRNSPVSSIAAICPTSSIIPVNIGSDGDVGTSGRHSPVSQGDCIRQAFDPRAADCRNLPASQDARRDECHNLINDAVLQRAESQIRAAFHHEALNLAPAQFLAKDIEAAADQEPSRGLFDPFAPVQNHAQQLAAPWQARAIGQLWLVFEERSTTGDNRIDAVPQSLHSGARFLRGDPLRFPMPRSDLPIQRHGDL